MGEKHETVESFTVVREDGSVEALCLYCGCAITTRSPAASPDRATTDHVHPTSRGGTNDKRNKVLVCRRCNQSKADLTLWEWIANGDGALRIGAVAYAGRAMEVGDYAWKMHCQHMPRNGVERSR